MFCDSMSFSIVALAITCLLLLRLASNWMKLNSVPGPFLAGISDLWRAYHQYRGQLRGKLLQLHQKHGPIVRYGVNSVSFSNPGAIQVIYGSRAGFVTGDSYKVLVGISNGKEVPSLVSTADEAKHGALRRSVAKAFTPTGVADYEIYVDQTIPELMEAISRHKVVDLAQMMMFYSMDAAMRIAFGEELGSLQSETDIGGTIQLIRDRFNHWGWWSSLPGLERLVYRNPISMRSKKAPSSMAAKAVSKLRARVSGSNNESIQIDLLEKFIKASVEFPDGLDMLGIVSMLMSTISGAGDTTATTMTAVIYNVLQNPSTLRTLRTELQEARLSEIPTFEQAQKLPCLNAVIKESMRVFSTPNWPMERKVPNGGATIAGMFFPEGTGVGCMPAAVHLDKKAFGEDPDVFRPGRWLEADEESLRSMEAAHLGFSRGRRVCLGQNIAVMQMKKVIPALILGFDMDLVHPDTPLMADFSSAVACLNPLYVRVDRRVPPKF